MALERLVLSLPEDLVQEMRAAGPDMDRFVLDAIKRDVTRRRQVDALRQAAGLWSHYEDILDTPQGIVDFVRKLRQDAGRRPLLCPS